MNPDARFPPQRFHQHFPRPSGTTPAISVRLRTNDLIQQRQVLFVQLGGTVIFSTIEQSPFAMLSKAPGDAINCGVMDVQCIGSVIGRPAVAQANNDQITQPHVALPTPPQALAQPFLDRKANSTENTIHGNSLLGAEAPLK